MSADVLPTEPTKADFRRLGAIVTLAHYRRDPECGWDHEEVSQQLWENRDGLPFIGIARAAMRAARDPQIQTPAAVGHHVAELIAA